MPIRLGKIENEKTNKHTWQYKLLRKQKQQECSFTAVGNAKWYSTLGGIWAFSLKLNISLSYSQVSTLLDIYPTDLKTDVTPRSKRERS